ncbi:hypothetical protein EB796_010231 [Bugula neritina]|uniref:Uncharacterized protein n=1 Tax=Bugula neritina TaxID=10212 RepID=A0A7J7K1I3_BUGNE|nr:hypothetical protein EB796_010231 [Bugula neritina]
MGTQSMLRYISWVVAKYTRSDRVRIMMYPVAVDGRMPFVDAKSYREQQIRKEYLHTQPYKESIARDFSTLILI